MRSGSPAEPPGSEMARRSGAADRDDERTAGEGPSLPPYSRRLHRLFALYLRRYARRHFHGVRLARDGMPPAVGHEPLVVFSNHPGWWDPLLYMLLADRFYPDRLAYGPMEAAELKRFRFFRRLGVFGVESGSLAGARSFLETSLAALRQRRSTLWITAEGRFTDPRRRPVELASGLAHLARKLERGTIVPLAIEYPFWDQRLPEALLRFGRPIALESEPARDSAWWLRRLEDDLETTLDRLAHQSARRDPRSFVSLLGGDTGTGGIYGLWKALRDLLTGDPDREAQGEAQGEARGKVAAALERDRDPAPLPDSGRAT